jgi:hypothetical protein
MTVRAAEEPLRGLFRGLNALRLPTRQKRLYVSSGSREGADRHVLGEDLVDLAGDVALESSEDVEVGVAIG